MTEGVERSRTGSLRHASDLGIMQVCCTHIFGGQGLV